MNNQNSLPMATRRLFLQRSMLALAATMVPPSLYAAAELSPAISDPQHPPLRVLSADAYQILNAVSDALIPSGGSFEPGARDIDLALRIDSYLQPEDTDLLAGIQGALLFMQHKAPSLIGSSALFSELDVATRERVLLALKAAGGVPLSIFSALRGLSIFYFYTDERVWPHIGYEGTLLSQSTPAQRIGG